MEHGRRDALAGPETCCRSGSTAGRSPRRRYVCSRPQPCRACAQLACKRTTPRPQRRTMACPAYLGRRRRRPPTLALLAAAVGIDLPCWNWRRARVPARTDRAGARRTGTRRRGTSEGALEPLRLVATPGQLRVESANFVEHTRRMAILPPSRRSVRRCRTPATPPSRGHRHGRSGSLNHRRRRPARRSRVSQERRARCLTIRSRWSAGAISSSSRKHAIGDVDREASVAGGVDPCPGSRSETMGGRAW